MGLSWLVLNMKFSSKFCMLKTTCFLERRNFLSLNLWHIFSTNGTQSEILSFFHQKYVHVQQVRRGSEPALNKNDNVCATGSSVQAVIASLNARSNSTSQVPRSLSSHAGLSVITSGSNKENMNNLRSSLRKTMVNNYSTVVSIDQDRAMQQSSPDSQYDGDSGSLNVMRRREPLGASGNKPERPK